jgi:hypothetical protein
LRNDQGGSAYITPYLRCVEKGVQGVVPRNVEKEERRCSP